MFVGNYSFLFLIIYAFIPLFICVFRGSVQKKGLRVNSPLRVVLFLVWGSTQVSNENGESSTEITFGTGSITGGWRWRCFFFGAWFRFETHDAWCVCVCVCFFFWGVPPKVTIVLFLCCFFFLLFFFFFCFFFFIFGVPLNTTRNRGTLRLKRTDELANWFCGGFLLSCNKPKRGSGHSLGSPSSS